MPADPLRHPRTELLEPLVDVVLVLSVVVVLWLPVLLGFAVVSGVLGLL